MTRVVERYCFHRRHLYSGLEGSLVPQMLKILGIRKLYDAQALFLRRLSIVRDED